MFLNAFGGLGKITVLGLVFLLALGLLDAREQAGRTGAEGFVCRGFTDDADLNRMLCRYHPARIWNMPISEVFSFLAPSGPAD